MITAILLTIAIGTLIFVLSIMYMEHIAYEAAYDEEQKEDLVDLYKDHIDDHLRHIEMVPNLSKVRTGLSEVSFVTTDTTPAILGPAEFEVPEFAKTFNIKFHGYEEKKKSKRKRKTLPRKQTIKKSKKLNKNSKLKNKI